MQLPARPARPWQTTFAVLLCLSGIALAAPTDAPKRKQPAPAAEWPATIRLGEATAVVDAPRADSLEGTLLKARGSLRVRRPEDAEAAVGIVFYEADVVVDRNARVVTLTAVRVPRVQLAAAPPARQQRIATRIAQELTRLSMKLPLDDVLAGVKLAARRDETSPKLGTEPPRVLFEAEPAILVIFDGEPRFRAVEGSTLERALNTPFLVLRDGAANAFYLDGGTTWFRAPDPTGPWSKTDVVPPEALRIARSDRKDAGIAEAEVENAKASAEARVPKILVTNDAAELIVSDGPPKWSPLVAGELETMSNTESDVFRTVPDGRAWLVISGRWYRGDSLSGPWTWVEPDQLPGSFRRIPVDSAKSSVLTFVPGTGAAREALYDAATPRTAAVKRKDAHVSVTWDGEPKFESVPGTQVEYALNTPEQVLRVRGRFYVCDQGVWFASESPLGPWRISDSLPEDDIQSIPPESPVYNTRFTTVYDSTPDVVYVAYTPAYLGSYPYHGTVVFGTGWAYRPWWGASYYPRPWTWGFHARYARWAGWGYGFGWGPAWAGFRYGFGFGWGARWCGPGGFYRPAYRNVNVTRTVNVARNVYTSGANTTRATTRQATAAKSAAPKASSAKAGSAGVKTRKGNTSKAKTGPKDGHAGGKKPVK